MTLNTTTQDGNWRIRWLDPRGRRTVYVAVLAGTIIDIQPVGQLGLDRPFKEFCQWLRKQYPMSFEREKWSEQLVVPEEEEPEEEEPVTRTIITAWPGVRKVTVDTSDPLSLSPNVARQCAEIQREWSGKEERRHRQGTSKVKPYAIPGAENVPWMPRGHHDFDGDDETDDSLLPGDMYEDHTE